LSVLFEILYIPDLTQTNIVDKQKTRSVYRNLKYKVSNTAALFEYDHWQTDWLQL